MIQFFKRIFIWWGGSTIGTQFFTFFYGNYVGKDVLGNIYYKNICKKSKKERRWVIYKNNSDPSIIPPGWHGWIHFYNNMNPSQEFYKFYIWEKKHSKNFSEDSLTYTKYHKIFQKKKYIAWFPKN